MIFIIFILIIMSIVVNILLGNQFLLFNGGLGPYIFASGFPLRANLIEIGTGSIAGFIISGPIMQLGFILAGLCNLVTEGTLGCYLTFVLFCLYLSATLYAPCRRLFLYGSCDTYARYSLLLWQAGTC